MRRLFQDAGSYYNGLMAFLQYIYIFPVSLLKNLIRKIYPENNSQLLCMSIFIFFKIHLQPEG